MWCMTLIQLNIYFSTSLLHTDLLVPEGHAEPGPPDFCDIGYGATCWKIFPPHPKNEIKKTILKYMTTGAISSHYVLKK